MRHPFPVGRLGGLSPRRRVLFLGVGLAAAVILAASAVLVVQSRVADRRAAPAQDRPGPVVLVPGYGGGTASLTVLAGRLRQAGRQAAVLQLPGGATGDLAGQARALDEHVARVLDAGAPSVDVVGYSAGGVVARLWVQRHDGPAKARRVVTLGSPHHGANLAAAGAAAAPGVCPMACQQLVPGSRLLGGLATPVPVPPQWLSMWTVQDETVRPVDSARLEGALNLPVQSVCPDLRLRHGQLPTDPVVTAFVLAALGPGPMVAPQPGRC